MKIDLKYNIDVMVFGQRFRPTRPLFNAWINKYSLNVVLLGYQYQVARPDAKRAVAEKLQKEGPLSACLSALYAHQGWLKEMRERATQGWGAGGYPIRESPIDKVPMPRRHGGCGRAPSRTGLNDDERAFFKGALGFEFGGDVSADLDQVLRDCFEEPAALEK